MSASVPMMILSVLGILGGMAIMAAGGWWLWAGRWTSVPMAAFQRRLSEPTRMVVGLAHLVLGYHLAAWSLPDAVGQRALQVPREQWAWVMIGCASVVAGSLAIDRWLPMEAAADENEPGDG